jgi:hypothetical protein
MSERSAQIVRRKIVRRLAREGIVLSRPSGRRHRKRRSDFLMIEVRSSSPEAAPLVANGLAGALVDERGRTTRAACEAAAATA